MAICNIAEDPSQSSEQFEQINAHLRATGPVPRREPVWSWPARPTTVAA